MAKNPYDVCVDVPPSNVVVPSEERTIELVEVRVGPSALAFQITRLKRLTAFVLLMSGVWKWVYYAPNTYKQLKVNVLRRQPPGASPGADRS